MESPCNCTRGPTESIPELMGKVRAFLEARNVEQLRRDCAVMGAAFRLPPFVNSTSTKLRHTGAGAGEKAGAGADEKADPESHLGVTLSLIHI